MIPTENNFISEEHFDVLLRHALLDGKKTINEKTSETMAQFIFTSDSTETIPDNSSIVEKLTGDFNPRRNNFRLNIFLISLFTLGTIAAVIFFTSRDQKITAQTNFVPVAVKQNLVVENPPAISQQALVEENPLPKTNPVIVAMQDSTKKADSILPTDINNNSPAVFTHTNTHMQDDSYIDDEDVPTLTDDDRKQVAKDKLKILREVGKKRIYSNLPAGATNVNGVLTPVNAFGIKDAEITNFEYRTFLYDLLVQGRVDDYLIAKPVKGGWKKLGIGEFEDVYFVSEKYDNFPAANMTRKGAEMYCAWMTSSLKEAITKKDIKWSGTKMPTLRLPSNVEWIYAARSCDTTIQYPWGNYSKLGVQNSRGCYLCDFNYSISKDKLSPEGPIGPKGCIDPKPNTRAIITTSGRSIDTLVTCPVYAYNPNNSYLFCTLGNVSEMVWTYDTANPSVQGAARSMGGSWYSRVDDVMIEAPEQYIGVTDARAYIGFRPVLVLQ